MLYGEYLASHFRRPDKECPLAATEAIEHLVVVVLASTGDANSSSSSCAERNAWVARVMGAQIGSMRATGRLLISAFVSHAGSSSRY